MGKSPEPKKREPMHGTQPGDRISGDRIVVECRKPGKEWASFRMSGNHNGFRQAARMNATAVVEVGFTNVRT
jgi:hypothetical protein